MRPLGIERDRRKPRQQRIDRDLAFDLREDGLRERLEANVATRLTYYPQGQPLGEGQLLKQPDLARTLERLRDEGPNGFYRGSVAQAILNTVGVEAGGRFEAADLETYTPRWLTPLRGGFRGRQRRYRLRARRYPGRCGDKVLS